MKKIVFIIGSLRKQSFNWQLAQYAESILQDKAEVSYLNYEDIPVFNQDLESPVRPSVARVRKVIMEADAIWLFSPVYNAFIPAPVKNLFDWLSRALDLSDTRTQSAVHQKLIAVSSVATRDYPEKVFVQYDEYLSFIRMNVLSKKVGVTINSEAWKTGELIVSPEKLLALQDQADALLHALKA